ncbi:ubiquitin-conjugating enzyme E2 W-like [Acyrthosiphon pisum]|uniref:N-terminal E2 ubiquitin-conjugating enzyme n=1 Tax=Acyrthosiphon pisum TaxID=7029 RepID=A0A8R2A450_ACYPI|nr:ubiquitin-conjugating enzyme E2 W-like [Acyrthosiphon pisum]|eukprot:XP_003241067.1 PREDICTED: ubiquitin-conjugating enzyme E2 W-like [Acyrthosiphon pisum]
MANKALFEKRLLREYQLLVTNPIPGMSVDVQAEQNLQIWIINIRGAEGTLYDGEQFQLQFKFNPRYPFESPEVTFVGQNIPVNPHVYSNGHICLSTLNIDWSPVLTVQSVCLSVISMLSSCKEKKRPEGDSIYVKTCSKNPKETDWLYDDDNV